MPGDQYQFRWTTVDHTIEGGEQGLDLALPPVELLGNQEPVGRVVFTEREVINPAVRLPFHQAAANVALEPACGLIAVLSRLGEQLHNDRRDGARDFVHSV